MIFIEHLWDVQASSLLSQSLHSKVACDPSLLMLSWDAILGLFSRTVRKGMLSFHWSLCDIRVRVWNCCHSTFKEQTSWKLSQHRGKQIKKGEKKFIEASNHALFPAILEVGIALDLLVMWSNQVPVWGNYFSNLQTRVLANSVPKDRSTLKGSTLGINWQSHTRLKSLIQLQAPIIPYS